MLEPTSPRPTTLADLLRDPVMWTRLRKTSSPKLSKLFPILLRRARHMDLVSAFGGKDRIVLDLYPRY